MDQAESIVVQVAPSVENWKIQEKAAFWWSLQGRQEMTVQGETKGYPTWFGYGYRFETKVTHYVKLHFVRSLNLPNLDFIREIENQYFSQPPPGDSRKTELIAQLRRDHYAAIALSPSTGKYGYSRGMYSLERAVDAAQHQCGAGDASIVASVRNGWCALAEGEDGSWGASWGETADRAREAALRAIPLKWAQVTASC